MMMFMCVGSWGRVGVEIANEMLMFCQGDNIAKLEGFFKY